MGMKKFPEEPTGGTETSDETKARLAKVEEFKTVNSTGYVELLMAMSEEVSFSIVDEAKTEELPGGDLAKAWKGLMDTFEPSTASTKVILKKQFYASKLSDAEKDPEEWITELELLRQRLKSLKVTVEDEDLVIHILNNLPKEYDSLVEAIEEDLNKGADEEVTVKRVRERVRARFRRMQLRQKESDGDELALLASGKKFKGRCGQCGKLGHKKENCWENPKNKKTKEEKSVKEERFCNFCKKKGHTEPYCNKKKKEEREKKDKKGKQETEESEMALMAHGEEGQVTSGDVWIADSGASMHATNSIAGMFDIVPCEIKITIGDGTGLRATHKGKKELRVIQPNNKVVSLTIKEVYYIPSLHCNLFSITSALSSGAKLVNDGLHLVLSKQNSKIVFDQVIKSSTGYLIGVKVKAQEDMAMVAIGKEEKNRGKETPPTARTSKPCLHFGNSQAV